MTNTQYSMRPWPMIAGMLTMLCAPAFAATPPGGTVSEGSPSTTWSGGPFVASNPGSCTGTSDPTCDNFNLTIVQPSFTNYVVTIAIDSTSAAPDADDYDLKVYGPDGSERGSSASSGSAEQVALFNPAPGVYRVEVQPFAVTPTSTYGGEATLINNTPPPIVTNPPASSESIFATPTMVDSQLHTGEPAIIVSPVIPQDGSRPLIVGDAPWGTSNATSLWWRSRNGGESFELVQDPEAAPRPRPCEEIDGGGDSWTAIDPAGRIYVNDLAALINITVGESTDGFQTMDCSKVGGTNPLQAIQDRQWIVATPDADGAGGGNIDAFITFRRGLIGGNPVTETAIQIYQSTDGGQTYQPVGEFTDFFGFSNNKVAQTGNPVVDWSNGPRRGTLYQSYYLSNTAKIGRWDPATTTFETFTVAERLSDVGNVFVTLGIDTAGNLYYAWVEGGAFDVLFTTSTDGGETWTSPVRVNLPGASELTVNPYLVAGSPGRVAVAFNGTEEAGSPDAADGQSWHYYVAQSLNALNANPSFTQYRITDTPLHFNSICTSGLGCSLQAPEGDRSLLEFNEVAVDPLDGSMVFIFADNGREPQPPLAPDEIPQPYIMFTRQITGSSMLAGKTVQNTQPRERSVTDRPGDSTYPKAGTTEGPQHPVLDLLGSRLQATDTGVRASIDVADLSNLLDALLVTYGTGDPRLTQKAVWVTRFEVVHDGLEEVYMLGMDLDRGSTEPMCFYGTPGVASNSGGPKRSNYSSEDAQANGAVTGSDCVDGNTINVEIPYAFMGIDFDTDPNPTFHSVTSFALVQPDANLDGNPVQVFFNNQRTVDATKAYDFEIGDFDNDGLLDFEDNCIEHFNPGQCDTNRDGYGNRCDADLNNNGGVTQADLGMFRSQFGSTGRGIDADLNCNRGVTQSDLGIFRALFNKPPGPSAFAP
ncbi:hypothetical protein BH24PSE2_BH24PSE2_08570 [soil metagenome]